MPRTSAVELPGCPPLRVLTTDVLGLVKVVEARGKSGTIPKMVETWGPPDASRAVLVASFSDDKTRPLLAIARKNSLVEILNPLNGHSLATIKVGESSSSELALEEDPIVGLHLLKTKRNEFSTRLSVLLMCTSKGKATLRSIPMNDALADPTLTDSSSSWDVCAAGKVICSSVDANEKYALFGGKGLEVNLWDIDKCSKTWTAKPPPCNSLGIFSPTWFTAATFFGNDHRKIVAGTNNNQVQFWLVDAGLVLHQDEISDKIRLYDISAQRRPVISVSFRETPIKALAEDSDGYTVYVGTGSGDLGSFDIRTGKLIGCFVGKCCGSIRSIARHPELPVLASCGLDSYLRLWDTKTRQLLSAVFLKQHLNNVMIDSHFSYEESTGTSADTIGDLQVTQQAEDDDDVELHLERCKASKKKNGEIVNKKKKKKSARVEVQEDDDDDVELHLERRKTSKKKDGEKVKKKSSRVEVQEDDQTNELPALKRRILSSEGNEQCKKRLKQKKSKKKDFQ